MECGRFASKCCSSKETTSHNFWICMLLLTFENVETSPECSMTYPCADKLGQGLAYSKPAQLKSRGGPWTVNLTVDIGTITYGWLELKRRLYNGRIPGPTITVRRGDLLTLNLKNNLSPAGNELGVAFNHLNHPNTTNIHTHGLHISSQDPQDNVLVSVDPGSHHQYVYKIHPQHASGTYFYHAHHHGATDFQVRDILACPDNLSVFRKPQVESGLSGMIIVEDDPRDMSPELSAVSCPDHCENDIQLLFQSALLYEDKVSAFRFLQFFMQDYIGFRMINSGGYLTLELYITDEAGNPTSNCEVREIALDGIYLPKPRRLRDGQTLLVAGAKTDWLVKCDTPGTYKVTSYPRESNAASIGDIGRYDGDLLTLQVSGAKSLKKFPSCLPALPPYLVDLQNVDQTKVKSRFTVELGPDSSINREKWSHPIKYRYRMRLNELQEWIFLNSDEDSHPLHMHVNHFQVISYNNYTGGVGVATDDDKEWYLVDINDQAQKCYYQHAGYDPEICVKSKERYPAVIDGGLGRSQNGDYRDTLLIPALTNVTIRFIPRDYVGDVIIHCHILNHEDKGMMMAVEIVKEGESVSADVTSGGAYPGTCRPTDRYPPNSAHTLAEEIGRNIP